MAGAVSSIIVLDGVVDVIVVSGTVLDEMVDVVASETVLDGTVDIIAVSGTVFDVIVVRGTQMEWSMLLQLVELS